MAKIDLTKLKVYEKFEGDLDIEELMFHVLFTFGGNKEYDIYSKIEENGGTNDEN